MQLGCMVVGTPGGNLLHTRPGLVCSSEHPEGRRDVQGSLISRLFLHFDIANKPTNQAVDRLRKLQPEEMLHEGMSSNILFCDYHDLQGRVHDKKTAIMAAADRVLPAPNTLLMGQQFCSPAVIDT